MSKGGSVAFRTEKADDRSALDRNHVGREWCIIKVLEWQSWTREKCMTDNVMGNVTNMLVL